MARAFDNRISLQKLEVLCLIVDLGGVSRAAEHLFVAQPVVTGHLRSLEERLGTRLLYRDGRTMRLTESGERVYAWANEVLARARQLGREIDGLEDGRRGSVVIAASMSLGSYVLPRFLAEFRVARPQAEITMHISDPEAATAAAVAGEADFAAVLADGPPEEAHLECESMGSADVVLVTAPDGDPSASSISARELEVLPLIASPRDHVRRAIVDRQLHKAGVEPRNVTIELGHPEAMKRAAQAGLGATLLFRSSVAQELAAGSLREIAIEDVHLSVPVFLIRRQSAHLTKLQDDLLDWLRHALRRELEPPPA
jgi:DNA-binding transcriptional LysR family regulator